MGPRRTPGPPAAKKPFKLSLFSKLTPRREMTGDPALTVVMAANGYPGPPEVGTEIKGLNSAAAVEGVEIFHAGTRRDGDRLLAQGGRVLNVTARGKTVAEAQARAYAAAARIDWPGGFYRHDIGWRAVEREKASA